MPGFPMKTATGYNYYNVVSALQKSIRRAMEEEAMYWAVELAEGNHFGHLMNRLNIIAHEDIGPANFPLLSMVREFTDLCRELKKKKGTEWKLPLANCIILMCQSPKSRGANELQCVIYGRRAHGEHKEIPDYAYDQHTHEGKKLGRGMEHFLTEAARLIPDDDPAPYREEAHQYWTEHADGKIDLHDIHAAENSDLFS